MKTRVPWEYFMKRRNISYSSLIGMEYDRYMAWCHSRYVIPLDKDEYESNIAPFRETTPQVVNEEKITKLPTNPSHLDAKLLGKKKKADLVDLCVVYGINVGGKETKKQLVSLILDVNNG